MSAKAENDPPVEFKCYGDRIRLMENFKIFLMITLSVVIYAYIYFQVTAIIAKSREIDRLAEITADINRRMNRLFELDHNMSVTLEKLRESYTRRMALLKEIELCSPME